MKTKEPLKIASVKGRPMLHWVGKNPLDVVRHFPAQLWEAVGVKNPPAEPSYREFIESKYNLLFHGDNKEILSSLLIAGFRGKVDLIYIDPPFDSGADYVRKVKLRRESGKLKGEDHNLIEQAQYEDIWANDRYLQFMYERLVLLLELLSEKGSIYVHCDWRANSYIRLIMDEIFGKDNFMNEISWRKLNSPKAQSSGFGNQKDSIFIYKKNKNTFNKTYYPYDENSLRPYRYDDGDGKGKYRLIEIEAQGEQRTPDRRVFTFKGNSAPYLYNLNRLKKWDEEGLIHTSKNGRHSKKQHLSEMEGVLVSDIWTDSEVKPIQSSEKIGYPTQKPEALLERIIKASSNEGDLVADFFCGSGTTAAVAERLGRRWIAADLNKGAIQTTFKRLQGISKVEKDDSAKNGGGGGVSSITESTTTIMLNKIRSKKLSFPNTASKQAAKICFLTAESAGNWRKSSIWTDQ